MQAEFKATCTTRPSIVAWQVSGRWLAEFCNIIAASFEHVWKYANMQIWKYANDLHFLARVCNILFIAVLRGAYLPVDFYNWPKFFGVFWPVETFWSRFVWIQSYRELTADCWVLPRKKDRSFTDMGMVSRPTSVHDQKEVRYKPKR